jgi:lysophospholipase L1-like esterase
MWKKLILIGDSHTEWGYGNNNGIGNVGWAGLVSNQLIRKADVVNRGFSGYNTKWIRMMLPELLSEFAPKNYVGAVVFLGTNDATVNGTLTHVSLADYAHNLKNITQTLTRYGITKERIIIIAPPKINDNVWAEFLKRVVNPNAVNTYFDHNVAQYAAVAVRVASQIKVHSVNLYELLNKTSDWQTYLVDGLHLNQKGNVLLYNALKPIIQTHIEPGLQQNYPFFMSIKPNQTYIPRFENTAKLASA